MKTWFVSVLIHFVDESEKYQSLECESYTMIVSAISEISAKKKAAKQAIKDFRADFDDDCQIVLSKILVDDIYETTDDARL